MHPRERTQGARSSRGRETRSIHDLRLPVSDVEVGQNHPDQNRVAGQPVLPRGPPYSFNSLLERLELVEDLGTVLEPVLAERRLGDLA